MLNETGNAALVDRLVELFYATFNFLAQSPRSGRPRPELRRGLRSHPVGSYTIFYKIRRSMVEIARVVHQRRDLDKVFPKRKRS
jgi:toxin ParE1/3/4